MSLFDDLAHLMPHTVQIRHKAGSNAAGQPTYSGATVAMSPARIVYQPVRYRSEAGDTLVASGFVIVGPTPALEPTIELTLPNGKKPPVRQVSQHADDTGALYQKVLWG